MTSFGGAYLLALVRQPLMDQRQAAHVLAGTDHTFHVFEVSTLASQETWCWLLANGLIEGTSDEPALRPRIEARWPIGPGKVNILTALDKLEQDPVNGRLFAVDLRRALREANLWPTVQHRVDADRRGDALALLIDRVIADVRGNKTADVWAELQRLAGLPTPPAPLIRRAGEDLVYLSADGVEERINRKALDARLSRRRKAASATPKPR